MLQIGSRSLCQRLIALGVTPKKTWTLKFPTFLTKAMLPSFLLGHFDGDGCIFVRKNITPHAGAFSVVCAVKDFLEEYKSAIEDLIPDTVDGVLSPSKTIFNLVYNRRKDIVSIRNCFYKNNPVFLQRKKDKFDLFNISQKEYKSRNNVSGFSAEPTITEL